MSGVTALVEAETFLWRHPWGTSDVDNPVEILRDLTSEAEELEAELQSLRRKLGDADELAEAKAQIDGLTQQRDKLVAFVRGLREQLKICDVELARALAIVGDAK